MKIYFTLTKVILPLHVVMTIMQANLFWPDG